MSLDSAATPAFKSLQEFVTWICETYRRPVDGSRHVWTGEWWKSAEVVLRMDALWKAYETLRLDPGTGLSVWWRDHLDYHMSVMLSTDGPLYDYTEESLMTRADYNQPLPCVDPPSEPAVPQPVLESTPFDLDRDIRWEYELAAGRIPKDW